MLKYVQSTVIYGVLLPAVIAGAGAAIEASLRSDADEGGGWGMGCGVALGYFVTHYGLSGEPELMPYIVGGVVFLVLVETIAVPRVPLEGGATRGIIWCVRVAAVPVITYFAATFMFDNYWSGIQVFYWPATFTILTVVSLMSLERIGERYPGGTMPWVAMFVGIGASMTLALNGTLRMAELVGGLVATAGGVMVVAGVVSNLRPSRGAATAFSMLLTAVCIYGFVTINDEQSRRLAGYGLLALTIIPHLVVWGVDRGLSTDDGRNRLAGWKGTAIRAGGAALSSGAVVGVVSLFA